ncbi:MAG: Mut7-C RNAse domain-containing protein [Candidatus Nitrosocaldus sp.]
MVRLLLDGMLGSMARKLRMFGFDTLYYNGLDDSTLLDKCVRDCRILITSDEELFQHASRLGVRSILVKGNGVDDMAHVLRLLGIRSIAFDISNARCSLCNSMIRHVISKDSLTLTGLPDEVLERYENFYRCDGCGKVYWEGSHIKRILEFEKGVNNRLAEVE